MTTETFSVGGGCVVTDDGDVATRDGLPTWMPDEMIRIAHERAAKLGHTSTFIKAEGKYLDFLDSSTASLRRRMAPAKARSRR